MQYKVISRISVDSVNHNPGSVVELSEIDAETFLHYGAIEPYIKPFSGGAIPPAPEHKKFGKLHQQIINAANEIRTQIADINDRLEDLQEDRMKLMNGTVSKSDYLELMRRDIRRQSAPYAKNMTKAIARNGYTSIVSLKQLDDRKHSLGIPYLTGDGLLTHEVSHAAMLFLFEDTILKRLADILDEMQWPSDVLPINERTAMVETLDAKITELSSQAKELVEQLEAAGITS